MKVFDPGVLGYMNKDLLSVINEQGLRGKDLIGMCLSHPHVNNICNTMNVMGKTIFDRLVEYEFGIPYDPKHFTQFKTAREFYIHLSSTWNSTARDNIVTKLKRGAELANKYNLWMVHVSTIWELLYNFDGGDHALSWEGLYNITYLRSKAS